MLVGSLVGLTISGGGASTSGLSTQVLTILSWKGVNRLLKHSRSALSAHVWQWAQSQYEHLIADTALLRAHHERVERMEHLKTLPAARAKEEETKQLRIEEEEGQWHTERERAKTSCLAVAHSLAR